MRIDQFEMERMQSIHWHQVEFDLSESGVSPLTIGELLGEAVDPHEFLATRLAYPLSEGSAVTRERIAAWYPDATVENITVVNGGSEANYLSLWTLLEPSDRLAFMVPNYMQGWGLGRHYSEGTDVFHLRLDGDRWALDFDELERAVTEKTRVIMVCNPNNPTGHVFTEEEMSAVVDAASRVGAWLVADEVYRGAEVGTDQTSPTFWSRYDKTIVTAGLSKAFALPGLRTGWVVAPPDVIRALWQRHDYTTLTPGLVSDELTAVAMDPQRREWILDPYQIHPRPTAAAAREVAADTRRHFPIRPAAGRRHRIRRVRPADRFDRAHQPDPQRGIGTSGTRRHARSRSRHPLRLRLRHRAHHGGPRPR